MACVDRAAGQAALTASAMENRSDCISFYSMQHREHSSYSLRLCLDGIAVRFRRGEPGIAKEACLHCIGLSEASVQC